MTAGAAMITGSTTAPLQHVLDAQGLSRVFFISGPSGSPAFVQLAGVTVKNGRMVGNSGGAIAALNSSLYIINSIVRDSVSEGFGAGVFVQNTPGIFYVESSLIENNVGMNVTGGDCAGGGFTSGGGVVISSVAEAYIFNSSIIGNQHCRWGGVASINSNTVLVQNTIARNKGVENGGSVTARGSGTLFMMSNTVAENEAFTRVTSTPWPQFGAGLFLWTFNGHADLYGNIFANNVNRKGGPGQAQPVAEDFWAEPSQAPFGGFTKTTHLNNFRAWPMATSADSMGIDDGYVGTNPVLIDLTNNGAGPGRFPLPTYSVSLASPLFRAYWPRSDLPGSVHWGSDQRGFARPSGQVTLGAIEP